MAMPGHLGHDHFGLFGTYFHALLMYSHICSPGEWPSFRAGNFMSNAQKKMSGDRLGPEISYLQEVYTQHPNRWFGNAGRKAHVVQVKDSGEEGRRTNKDRGLSVS